MVIRWKVLVMVAIDLVIAGCSRKRLSIQEAASAVRFDNERRRFVAGCGLAEGTYSVVYESQMTVAGVNQSDRRIATRNMRTGKPGPEVETRDALLTTASLQELSPDQIQAGDGIFFWGAYGSDRSLCRATRVVVAKPGQTFRQTLEFLILANRPPQPTRGPGEIILTYPHDAYVDSEQKYWYFPLDGFIVDPDGVESLRPADITLREGDLPRGYDVIRTSVGDWRLRIREPMGVGPYPAGDQLELLVHDECSIVRIPIRVLRR